jgi:hypothetical protein
MKKFFSYIKKPNLLKRLWKKFLGLFYFEQWAILVTTKNNQPLIWADFKKLTPPKDRFWADPFTWIHNNEYYIFYEELPFATNKGHISYIKLAQNLQIIENQIILQKPYHLSYPFIFEYENQLYMMPETKENKSIEIYQCKNFPNEWVLYKTIMTNVAAVDSTLLQENGKWWLFANIAQSGGNAYDSLYLFYANSPFADTWTPHPLNPIVKDIKSARPAGRIFKQNNQLIRPSQDCSNRYGYAINFNQITTLNEKEYSEINQQKFIPPNHAKNILATHTWNNTGNLTTIDAEYWQSK